MFFSLWTTRAAKACAVLSAAFIYRLRGNGSAPPILVDIGARGGLQRKWRLYGRLAAVQAIMIEADPEEVARLRQGQAGATVVNAVLGEQAGPATLHVTSDPGCSSLLLPSAEAQAIPDLGYRLRVQRTLTLTLTRADDVFAREGLPQPDFLKIDTQGTELAILKGFGSLLDRVVGLEIECEFFAVYQGQPLIVEICEWLRERGFALEALRPNGLYGRGILDANAFFVRRSEFLDPRQVLMSDLWRRINRIPDHFAYVIDNG